MDRILPEYSVLMSVYAKENPEYLKSSIESILNQTVKTSDFVLVCDGPLTSELENVIACYSERLNVVRLRENMGLGAALQKGILSCGCELIARMDSDDISIPERCELQLQCFADDPDLDIVSGTVLEFMDNSMTITGQRKLPCEYNEIVHYSKKRCPFNHPNVMYRKTTVIAAGSYSSRFRMEDYYLWIRMLQKGAKCINLNKALLFMRTSADMYMRRGGIRYAKDMLKFHWWIHKSGWSSIVDFITGAIPHGLICIMPNTVRKYVYKLLH